MKKYGRVPVVRLTSPGMMSIWVGQNAEITSSTVCPHATIPAVDLKFALSLKNAGVFFERYTASSFC